MVRAARAPAALLAATVALSLAGCGASTVQWRPPAAQTPPATTEPTPAVTPSGVPTSTETVPADQLVLSVDGIGPYEIGKSTVNSLESLGLITALEPYYPEFCTGIKTALGTGGYTGMFTLYFKDDLLVAVLTGAEQVRSVSGARVGMTTSRIKQIYGNRVKESDGYGGTKIYTVTVDDRVLVMQTTDTSSTIREMFAQLGTEPVLTPKDGPACDSATGVSPGPG